MDAVTTPSTRRLPARVDAVLSGAAELARAAAIETGGDTVGDHLGVSSDGERIATHRFAATVPGYRGWIWSVSVARAPRAKVATVDEVVLLPDDGALLAPAWVPWSERVQAGDLAPGDLLPTTADDPRLVPSYTDTTDPNSPVPDVDTSTVDREQIRAVADELGLGRIRVMSRWGREDAAARWADGDGGPDTSMARHAPGPCGTCGFWLPLKGSLSALVGVCGNEQTDTDGRVVTADHGCGAHSESAAVIVAETGAAPTADAAVIVYDDGEVLV